MSHTTRILVTLCTYNERENLAQLIPEIHQHVPEADILVVDDNSPDGTGDFVDELAADDGRIHAIHRAGKLGLGTATVAAFQWGIQREYDWLVNLDADFSHPPAVIPSLLRETDHADVVIASRYVAGGGIEGWGWHRKVMSRGINVFARTILGLRTRDNSGSFRCYRVATLAKVDWSGSRAKGFAILEEILFRLKQAGARFAEVPYVFEERRFGESKISWKEATGAINVLLRLRFAGPLTESAHKKA